MQLKLFPSKRGSIIKLISLVLGIFFCGNAGAQTQDASLPRKEFRITLETVMYQKLIVTSGNEKNLFKPRDAPSGILSLSGLLRLKANYSIELTTGVTVIPTSYKYDFQLNGEHPLFIQENPKVSHSDLDYFLPSVRFGVFLSKDFLISSNSHFSCGIGIHRNTFPSYGNRLGVHYQTTIDGKDSSFRLSDLSLEGGESGRYWFNNFSYSAKFGYFKRNSKGNGYGISMVVNHQPGLIGKGNHVFNMGDSMYTSQLTWKNNYYGLQFSWNFHLNKKTIETKNES